VDRKEPLRLFWLDYSKDLRLEDEIRQVCDPVEAESVIKRYKKRGGIWITRAIGG